MNRLRLFLSLLLCMSASTVRGADYPRGELLVVTLWEDGEAPQVPRRFTDALKDRRRSG
jgi:hypothetical protein